MKSSDDSLDSRRLKREERRSRQRAQNIFRAQKMHAALLASDSKSPYPDNAPPPRINVGCSGWFYWHWRGVFYPADAPPSAWFEHYSSLFSTVELNAPFYSWPTIAAVKTWVRQANGRPLTYTVKVNELITHTKRFVRTGQLVRDFGFITDLLGSHMGCLLFQLPPSYNYTASRLKSIVTQLDPTKRNVVEFRHRSWWNQRVYSAFRERGIIFCSCSGPRLPDELIKTAEDIYVRFHGTKRWYRHDYTSEELEVWTQRIQSAQPQHVWAYFNNDRDGYAIKNAIAFRELLNK